MNRKTGDCAIRAISTALNQSWEKTYIGLCLEGFIRCDLPTANHVWGEYLKSKGFKRYIIPNECPDCYSVCDFCREHSRGTYILALSGHVVAVKNGNFFDTWDSGAETPLYYWQREET